MNRQEATEAISMAWFQRDQEFLTTPQGARESNGELQAALAALTLSPETTSTVREVLDEWLDEYGDLESYQEMAERVRRAREEIS